MCRDTEIQRRNRGAEVQVQQRRGGTEVEVAGRNTSRRFQRVLDR
jgi:hypothetical protein